MKHYLGTWAAPSPHHPSLSPEVLTAALPGATLEHTWEPHGFTLLLLTSEVRLILHTWPEHGLVTLDLYGAEDLAARADALGQGLGWRKVEESELVRLLPDRQSL